MSHLDLTPDDSVPTQLPSESMTAKATTPNQPANPQPVSQKPAQPTSQSISQSTSQSSSQSTSQADSMVGLKIAVNIASPHCLKNESSLPIKRYDCLLISIIRFDYTAKNRALMGYSCYV